MFRLGFYVLIHLLDCKQWPVFKEENNRLLFGRSKLSLYSPCPWPLCCTRQSMKATILFLGEIALAL